MAIIVAALLASCAEDRQHVTLVMDGIAYDVPAAHVKAHTSTPHQFVRIKTPDQPFELAYDGRLRQRTAPSGWPVIFSLNDGTAPNLEHFESGGHKIVCRRASAPKGGCGFRLVHRGTEWSVLFQRDRLPAIGEVRAEAAAQLESYRRELPAS